MHDDCKVFEYDVRNELEDNSKRPTFVLTELPVVLFSGTKILLCNVQLSTFRNTSYLAPPPKIKSLYILT